MLPRLLIASLLFSALFFVPICPAEEADDLREKGIAALKESQANPRAIVEAARCFVKAGELYNAAGNEEKNVEMNSFLYWCKKKMTMEDIDAFTKGGEAAVSTKLAAVEKLVPKSDEAQNYFDRAEQFANNNPGEHMLIAVRFYEVADRFKGSDASLKAQDRSLKEMLLDKSAVGEKTNAPPVAVRAAEATPVSVGSRAMPTVDEAKAVEKTIKDLFKDEYAKTDAAGQSALVAKLLQQADENKDDAPTMYVLLHEARDHAVAAGDVALATDAQKRLRDAFKIDFAAMLLDLRKLEASARTAGPATVLAALLSLGAEDALAIDNFELAVKYNSRAEDLLPLIKDATLKEHLKVEVPRVLALKVASTAALAAQKTLATKPNDADANFVVGKFALQRGDFDGAFGMLAKGKDETLKSLAKREAKPSAEAEDQVALGDAWFDAGEKEANAYLKARMKERAAFWYTNALPVLSGLGKLKVEVRLKSLPKVAGVERPAGEKVEAKTESVASTEKRWISKNATYIASSIQPGFDPMPALLNGERPAHRGGGEVVGFSFHTKEEENPFIVVDLGRTCRIENFEIVNRNHRDAGDRARTLSMWVSSESTGPWTEAWKAAKAESMWSEKLPVPATGRYVKLGLREKNQFHLASIKFYGVEATKTSAATSGEKRLISGPTANLPTQNGSIPAGKLNSDIIYGPGELKLNGTVQFESLNNGEVKAEVVPGTMLSGGEFNLGRPGNMTAIGTQENPCIFKNVKFAQDLSANFFAKGAVFENCTFTKSGGWMAYFATKWRFHGCTFYKCTFGGLSGANYGFVFHGCTFISMKLPEIKHNSDGDYLKWFRWDWNQIGGCSFIDCDISPTVFWCSEQSSFITSRFETGLAVPLGKSWEVEAFIVNCTGKLPTESMGESVKIVQAKIPYPGPTPPMCNLPELAPAYKLLADMHRNYKWISKDATYTSSSELFEPSPTLLDGNHGCPTTEDRTFAFQTKREDAPFIIIDLKAPHSVAAIEIENRSIWIAEAKTLTAWIGDSPTGPWVEIWKSSDSHRTHWQIVLEKAINGRYVKLGLTELTHFHLNEMRVFEKR